MERKLNKVWTSSAFDREKGEWVHTENQSYEIQQEDDTPTWQAEPADIRPSRKKGVKRDHKVLVAFGDMQAGFREVRDHKTGEIEQIPLHDERALKVARYIMRDLMPDTIVNLSDSVDLASLSRFKPDSNHFQNEMGPAFQAVHDYYAQLRADSPDARIVEVSSNHNQRLNDHVLKHFPQAYDLHRPGEDDYPVLSYPYLANLKHLDVEWRGGYPAGEFVYDEGGVPIVYRHGTETGTKSTAAASKIRANNPENHTVQGHSHEVSEAWFTHRRSGRMLGSFAVGAMCRTDGVVPGYHSGVDDFNRTVPYNENWQQSIHVTRAYKNGDYEMKQVMIKDGKAYMDGKLYEA